MSAIEDPEAEARAAGAHCPTTACWWESWSVAKDGLVLTIAGAVPPRMEGVIAIAKLLQPGIDHILVVGAAGPLVTYQRSKSGTWAAFRPRRRWQRRSAE